MLRVENVSHSYGQESVLNAINLTIGEGEIICLLGESGSGKTTLLRVIAGLETGYIGNIVVNTQIMRGVPVHQRGFGLMFQDFALFPHMTVAQNVAFGLRMQGFSKKEQQQIVNEMLVLVGLEAYQERGIDALSGGEKQRVALARSLAPRPKLLMLDEPLGSLDAGLRQRLVVELRGIIKQIGLTAIYVTHDQQEAYAIADRIAVMNSGQIEQFDTPEQVYHQPKTAFVARFLGLSNIVSADFLRNYINLADEAENYLLHPQSLVLDANGTLEARVLECVFQGDNYRLKVLVQNIEFSIQLSSTEIIPREQEIIRLTINSNAIQPLFS